MQFRAFYNVLNGLESHGDISFTPKFRLITILNRVQICVGKLKNFDIYHSPEHS
jgi:hypothetical protein